MTYFGLKDVFFEKKMAKRTKTKNLRAHFTQMKLLNFWKIYTNNTATWKR